MKAVLTASDPVTQSEFMECSSPVEIGSMETLIENEINMARFIYIRNKDELRKRAIAKGLFPKYPYSVPVKEWDYDRFTGVVWYPGGVREIAVPVSTDAMDLLDRTCIRRLARKILFKSRSRVVDSLLSKSAFITACLEPFWATPIQVDDADAGITVQKEVNLPEYVQFVVDSLYN